MKPCIEVTYQTSLDKFFIPKEEREAFASSFGNDNCGEDFGIIRIQFSRTVGFEVVRGNLQKKESIFKDIIQTGGWAVKAFSKNL